MKQPSLADHDQIHRHDYAQKGEDQRDDDRQHRCPGRVALPEFGELQKSKTRLCSQVTVGACGDVLSEVRSWDRAAVNDDNLARQQKRQRGRRRTTWSKQD